METVSGFPGGAFPSSCCEGEGLVLAGESSNAEAGTGAVKVKPVVAMVTGVVTASELVVSPSIIVVSQRDVS